MAVEAEKEVGAMVVMAAVGSEVAMEVLMKGRQRS
jgi:hypothetical protein